MSDDNNNQELVAEIRELSTALGRMAENHKSVLQRHEEDIHAAFRTCKNHHGAIEILQVVVERQNQILERLEESMTRVLAALAMEAPPAPTPKDHKAN
jgi:hypothetical protein